MTSIHSCIDNRLYVGNKESSSDLNFLADSNITYIVNLSGKPDSPIEDVEIIDFVLPEQELMDTEFPKTYAKLDQIASTIKVAYDCGHSVLVHCSDGKNKCMLAIGYYLINCGRNYMDVINMLETTYFTQQQRQEYNACSDDSPENIQKYNELRKTQCLTMQSHRKMLRLKGGAKK